MMAYAHDPSPDASVRLESFQRAIHIATSLLAAHEKHKDLPIMLHVHSCLVLACSDKEDCYLRCQEAYVLVQVAMQEGILGLPEGAEMMRTCAELMGRVVEHGAGDNPVADTLRRVI